MFWRKSDHTAGHNPLGGWSVMAMLATMLLQTLLGLVAVDVDGIESGPLSYLVSFDTGHIAATTHHYVFNILLFLIGLHIAAIIFHHFYKKQNLTKLMITGGSIDDELPHRSLFSSSLLSSALFIWSVFFVFFLTTIVGR
jgi:cytochrome b